MDGTENAVDGHAVIRDTRQERQILARLGDEITRLDQALYEQFVHQGRR